MTKIEIIYNNPISKLFSKISGIKKTDLKDIDSNNSIAILMSCKFSQFLEKQENELLLSKNKIIIRVFITKRYVYIKNILDSYSTDLGFFISMLKNNQEFHDTIILENNDDYVSLDDDRLILFLHFLALRIKKLGTVKPINNDSLIVFDRLNGTVNEKKRFSKQLKSIEMNNEHLLFTKNNIQVNNEIYRIKSNINFDYLYSKLVDPEFGIAKHTFYVMNSKFFPMISVEAMLDSTFPNNAYGRDFDFESSRKEAILEALERYYNSADRQNRIMIYGSYNELKKYAINPRKFILHGKNSYENKSFSYIPYNDDIKFNWLWGWSIKNNTYSLIPSQLCHYHDSTLQETKERFVYECSNGASIGSSLEEALLHSMFETIERDNFLVSFYAKLKLKAILLTSINNNRITRLVKFIESNGFKIYLFDISLELKIPSIWCLCINNNDNAVVKTYSAAGCSFNPEEAIISGLIEVITSISVYEDVFSKEEQLKRRKYLVNDTSNVTLFEDHVLYYSTNESKKHLDYLLKDIDYMPLEAIYPDWYVNKSYHSNNLNTNTKKLINIILKNYEDIFVADLSDPFLIKNKLHCCKVLIPGMLPMTFGIQNQRISYKRLNEAKLYAWKIKKVKSIGDNLKVPHPFP